MVLGYFKRLNSTVLVTSAFAVAATSGLCLLYYYHKRKQNNVEQRTGQELRRRRIDKLVELREKLEQLLDSLDLIDPESPETEDDECIVCNSAKAIIQTYPCKHKVLCRRCFVKTLQVAVNDLNLPLKCVLCRTRISTLDRERHEGMATGRIQQQNYGIF